MAMYLSIHHEVKKVRYIQYAIIHLQEGGKHEYTGMYTNMPIMKKEDKPKLVLKNRLHRRGGGD